MVRFSNVTEDIRTMIISHIEYIVDNCQTGDQINRAILYYFYMMRNNNYKLYKNIIGLIASDHYKMINDLRKYEIDLREDYPYLNLYENISNQDELIYIIEEEPSIILEIITYMNEFNSLDYFEKRESYLNCKDNLNVLFKLSSYSILDYLYYCQKYDFDILNIIYKEQVEILDSKDEAINSLITTMEELFMTDLDNYKDLVVELLSNYYMIGKKQLQRKNKIVKRDYLMKNIRLIENGDIVDILNRLRANDYKFLIEVLRRNLNGYNENIQFNDNDLEKKTLKKIYDIKKINTIE